VCGIRVNVAGLEHVEPNVPRIYMTNHQSFFDIFALLACLPVHFKFIMKQELMKIPFLGPAMRRAEYIGIERDDPRKALQSMKQAAEKIRSGASVLIFPEGTRSLDGKLQEFKRGGFNLAVKAGCDIVPIGIRDSYRIAPKGSLKIQKGSFDLHIGKPISLKGVGKRDTPQLMEQVRAEMMKQIEAGSPKTGATARSRLGKVCLLIWMLTSLLWVMPGGSAGYVMPAQQMIDKMSARFSRFHTLIVDQTIHVLDRQDGESAEVVRERIWLRSPGYCRSEIVGGAEREQTSRPEVRGAQPPMKEDISRKGTSGALKHDTTFRWLLMANEGTTMLAFLTQLGVNVNAVAFARLDGKVVYRIGDPSPESPKLLIDRESFLPLLLSYVSPGRLGEAQITVRFDNFKEVDSGWYPYRIDYTQGEEQAERYFVLNIRVNPSIKASFFEAPADRVSFPGKTEDVLDEKEEERLKEAIRQLKEKHGE